MHREKTRGEIVFCVASNPILESHQQIDKENEYQLIFVNRRINNIFDHWHGTVLKFSGNQSTYLYKMIQETGLDLDWEAFDFDNTNVSRIDVC